jgi:integrase
MASESRRQLPPQIKRIELAQRRGGRPVVRYQLTVDTGERDGKRKQFRKRYTTEKQARAALDGIRGAMSAGTFVQPEKTTLRQACDDWLAVKHSLKPSTLHGHRTNLEPALAVLGDVEVQKLTKRQLDDLVAALRCGGLPAPNGGTRKPWSPRSVNYLLGLLSTVLKDQQRQGHVVRNVAELVDRIPSDPKPPNPLTAAELRMVLEHITGDRHEVAWRLALSGLRRGEIAGLRWSDVDLDAKTVTIAETRLRFGKTVAVDTPKSRASRRTLPLPDRMVTVLRATKRLQTEDRVKLGPSYQGTGYVVVNEAGEALSPHALTSRWERMLTAAGVRHVRLHDARHTCGTMMHLDGTPTAVISAWLGHASKAFTMQTYVNPHEDALSLGAEALGRVLGD